MQMKVISNCTTTKLVLKEYNSCRNINKNPILIGSQNYLAEFMQLPHNKGIFHNCYSHSAELYQKRTCLLNTTTIKKKKGKEKRNKDTLNKKNAFWKREDFALSKSI
jgi:hypothetical protein